LWPLAGEARYGDLGTGYTAPVSQALTVEQRVADEDVLQADDGSDEKANGMALSASQDAKLPRIVIVHSVCVYWGYSNISTNLVDGCSQHW
jgi:hypothetical protein